MAPDPVLRDNLNESLTYSEYRDIAHLWQKYTEKKHPSSRDLDSVMAGHDMNIHAQSAHVSFSFSNFGCLLRQLGMGSRKNDLVVYYSSRSTTDVSIVQLWARNWGHIRATCESSCLTRQLCRDDGIENCFGIKILVSPFQ